MPTITFPVLMRRGDRAAVASRWTDYYSLLWDGFSVDGPAPTNPNETVTRAELVAAVAEALEGFEGGGGGGGVDNTALNAAISTALANLVGSVPANLDTLNELAASLGDDANFAATMTAAIAAAKARSEHTGNWPGTSTTDFQTAVRAVQTTVAGGSGTGAQVAVYTAGAYPALSTFDAGQRITWEGPVAPPEIRSIDIWTNTAGVI